ncbi:BSD-like protein [Artemisia annua]|uniref:BSD-like protein n=1 Tax=Artemisia annua TaxID=35608 RepID=A0A2U1MIT2_ARTAN|nr:BSD-like protein [Artemisia annua]
MSWLARSIANTLNLEDEDTTTSPNQGGIKQDLSDLTQTLTQGITSFISPGPSDGIRRDFAEIGGKFRTSISNLSNNLHVPDFTKLASGLLQLDSDSDNPGVRTHPGSVTRDGQNSIKPKTVLNWPKTVFKRVKKSEENWIETCQVLRKDCSYYQLKELDRDLPDFKPSDVQQEHALAVERLVPGLSALRIELCPGYMSESSFWKIYFVLLHPRLERHAAELLSTHEILKARATLTHELKNRPYALSTEEPTGSNLSSENLPDSVPLEVSAMETCTPTVSTDTETVKHQIHSDEIPIVDKSAIQEEPHDAAKAEDDTDDWLKEESSEIVSSRVTIPIGNDEDATYTSDSSTKESQGWVQLGRSSTDSGKDSDFSTIDVA